MIFSSFGNAYRLHPSDARKKVILQAAETLAARFNPNVKILGSLCVPPYLAEGTNSHAILNHSVGSKPGHAEVDVSLIYADYYFLEAMLRWRAAIDIRFLRR